MSVRRRAIAGLPRVEKTVAHEATPSGVELGRHASHRRPVTRPVESVAQPEAPVRVPVPRPLSADTLHEITVRSKEMTEDPFTAAVVRRLGNDILLSLTEEQRQRMMKAIYDSRPLKEHPLDLRGVVPFFFWRFYYVLLMGRDRRTTTSRIETERRRRARFIEDAIHAVVLLWHVVFVLAVVLYLVKSALGINLMPHRHAWELLLD